jgi:hypothetical protein
VLLIVTVPALAGAQTLREQVLTAGISEEVLLVDYPSLALRDLTSAANAVVHVSIRSGASFLSDNGESMHTDYPAAVIDVVKASGSRVKRGDVITIRRAGGVMDIDGRKVFSNESGFPQFESGEYVLFLKKSGKAYALVAGPQSAFRVHDGTIAPAADEQRSAAVLMPQFVSEVRGNR